MKNKRKNWKNSFILKIIKLLDLLNLEKTLLLLSMDIILNAILL
jgi:hypothetical protein